MWKHLRRWFSSDSDPANGDRAEPSGPGEGAGEGAGEGSREEPRAVVTLRNLEVARKFPQELPDDAMGPATGERHTCGSCGGALKGVIITTGGPFGDPAVWDAYPLALDGWQCEQCENISFPAFLSPDEIAALINASIASAQAGAFDEAEYGFRRAISSWPTYMPARVNFGSMCLDRIRAEQEGENRTEVVDRYAKLAEAQFRKSLTCEPPAPIQVRFMLGRLLYRRGPKDEGAAMLEAVMKSPETPASLRKEIEVLLAGTN
jgi:hypothetical protein